MSSSPNSVNGGYIGCSIGEYYTAYFGVYYEFRQWLMS